MSTKSKLIAIIGGGPAGLMAAEVLSEQGHQVHVFDAMPTVGRKFLRAGIGGLNLTFDEPFEVFLDSYSTRRDDIEPLLKNFTPDDLIAWVHHLGIKTFVGSSRRVFPREKKAAPLLRAWLHRLKQCGVVFHLRHRWLGWKLEWNRDTSLRFKTPMEEISFKSDAVLFAMGGGSWPQLGSDASWVKPLSERGVLINPLRPANCGFVVNWTPYFSEHFAGQPIKSVRASIQQSNGDYFEKTGDLMVSKNGIEGGLIYALSSRARDEIEQLGNAVIHIDLTPDCSLEKITKRLLEPKNKNTTAKHLKNKVGIDGVKMALLREYSDKNVFSQTQLLAKLIKSFPITLIRPNPLAEVISTAGGVSFAELDERQMLNKLPGVFCAGEMLDWEAPTGGYLLSACFASGYAAGQGILQWLRVQL